MGATGTSAPALAEEEEVGAAAKFCPAPVVLVEELLDQYYQQAFENPLLPRPGNSMLSLETILRHITL